MYTILIAEDDQDIVKILSLYLENEGYQVLSVNDGCKALEVFNKNRVDLALLDIMMPNMDGYELTHRLRQISNIPIIFLSAKNEDSDKILGLNMGADDYMTKPFNPLEVVARVQSNLRRYYKFNEQKQEVGKIENKELILDTSSCKLTKNGEEIPLTSTEYKILLLLMQNPGRIYTKLQIYEHAIGESFDSDENTIMVHISRLKSKIEDDVKNTKYIKTVRGLGYKIER